jgi:hypothetical protein
MTLSRSMRPRTLAFALVVLACAAGIAGYARHVAHAANAAAAASLAISHAPLAAVPDPGGGPFVMFRSTALGSSYGHVTLARLDDPAGPRQVAPIACDRVYYAAGAGVCLIAERGALTVYRAVLFDNRFAIRRKLDLAGPPSRARVSPDGTKVAFTVFINGHAYSNPGFTTRTSIIDATTGASLVDDLEAWPVTRDSAPFKATDFNFWGVTFAREGPRFYATLGSGGRTWLVEGDLSTRRMRVVADDVECPSLSPDGKRIAFKRREARDTGGRFLWHVAVLDLASGKATILASETRSVDDQVEWNGDDEILYGMPLDSQQSSAETDVWAIAADGGRPPRRLLPFAFSPAVVR